MAVCAPGEQEMLDMRYALTEQKREIQMLRELVKAMRISNPNARAIGKFLHINTTGSA